MPFEDRNNAASATSQQQISELVLSRYAWPHNNAMNRSRIKSHGTIVAVVLRTISLDRGKLNSRPGYLKRYTAMSNINDSLTYPTDGASLILYDVAVARAAGLTDPDSWSFEYASLEPVRDGRVAVASLGGDGVYKVRITDGDLTQDERDYAAYCLEPLGLRIESGRLCVSGYWFDADCAHTIDVPPGNYSVALYDISYWQSPRWWREDERTPDDAPADYVAVLRPHDGPLAIPNELALDYLRNWEPGPTKFLFDSTTRIIGPQIGMELVSTVRKSGDGFILKQCGPGDYQATLTNYDNLARSDKVRFRVVSVDHEQETLVGELVTKLA